MAKVHALSPDVVESLVRGDHSDPFAVLGLHVVDGAAVVRSFQPQASAVQVVDPEGGILATLERVHPDGLFAGAVPERAAPFRYLLRIEQGGHWVEVEDTYRFPPVLGDVDLHLIGEGTHLKLYEKLGAHPRTHEGVAGVAFVVWAPSARRVSVVGDFNNWDGRRHVMRARHGAGCWEIFIPGLPEGTLYKFEIKGPNGEMLPLKADPYAFRAEHPPQTASVVHGLREFAWSDGEWMGRRHAAQGRSAPISIYEVHLGSWRRGEENRYLTYRELADELVPYVAEMGFSHIELLPITEFPFDGSWGYQPIGLYAPTIRHGTPEDFAYFVDRCHQAGIGILLDWVPGHFPTDPHGLGLFDGTHLYEHADPRQGFHLDWNTLIFNYGRREVQNYLIGNALFWLDRYHLDGLRVDAVASMLYLDYSRKAGEWVPNQYGGNENLEAIAFLKRMNELTYGHHNGIMTVAEESTAWPAVSRPAYLGGLGFGFKWNMGWMHDTLRYIGKDPIHRRYHHHDLTFGLLYAFSENFVLPISHDEVVHGKGSLLARMPGDTWQQFANMRAYLSFMFAHPGKKLLFMGCEFAQGREWNHNQSLDWHLLDIHWHKGVQTLVRDLNHLYRNTPALHERDCEPEGFQWLEANDSDNSILSFARLGYEEESLAVVVCNFTPNPHRAYRLGVPRAGRYVELLSSDAEKYGGSGIHNAEPLESEAVSCHGRENSITVTVPPLGVVVLEWQGR
ncbi:MAG TPA: 1,4-alpha-glucan branching protein GlgB [Alphaproteobacteria bacterium]|nr:1,4-alpha-glucan branching protein GlgB [Alphaproteobacteria bacterium]